jgi:hypothetical protein
MCSSSVGTAIPTVQIENETVRVTRWVFAKKGDNTGWHRHGHDYVVVPLFDGALDIRALMAQSRRLRCRWGQAMPAGLAWSTM